MTCNTLVVMGGGVMGQGIARLFAGGGITVTLVDMREIDFACPGVTVAREPPRGPAPDLVIEAVFEDRAVKQSVFAQIEDAYGGVPALATNTSGLPLDALAAPLKYPQRFLAMHFFQPADVFPMIEVVRGARTEDSAIDVAVSAIKQAGREPILLQRAVNGYLINRLQHSILHEAYHLLESGIATAEMIDNVAKKLLGPRLCITGLLEQKDIGGLEHARVCPTVDRADVVAYQRAERVPAGHGGARGHRGGQWKRILRLERPRPRHRAASRERAAAAAARVSRDRD